MRLRGMGRRAALVCFASGAALLSGNPALAQDAGGAAKAAADSGPALEEVVVTARRREERLQDVPVAVTAMTPERLKDAQVTTARQLVGMVPSLNIATGNQRDFQRYTIRGQGATVGASEGVGVYFAEAPLSQYVAGGPGLYFDLENLQVLNGPQGTLFGRNTTGGAVLFTPKKPTNNNEGFVQAGYGNYNNKEGGLVLNYAPMPDVLRVRLSAEARKRDGFTHKITDGSDFDDINYYTVRAGILFTPNDKIENYLVANFSRSATGGTGVIMTDINPTGVAERTYGLANFQAQLAAQQQLGLRFSQGEAAHWWYSKNFIAVNTTTVQLPANLALKNVASFTRSRQSGGFDNDGTSFNLVGWLKTTYSSNISGLGESRNEYLTDELQLSGKWLDDNLNWVVGGFYQNTYPYGYQQSILSQFGTITPTVAATKSQTHAAFGQGTLDFGAFSQSLSGLKLTLGYRYTWDSKHYNAAVWRELGATRPCSSITGAFYPNCTVFLNGKWKAPTYTAGLDYKITPTILAYGTIRSGYKSGGFNQNANTLIPTSFGPEKVVDHEIGLKADFHLAGMPVRTNVAAFKDDYKDIQRSVFRANPLVPGQILTFLANASAATIKGFEGQVFARPISNLEVSLNYSYLDAKYKSYLFLDASTNVITDFKGHSLPFSPRNKVGLALKYDVPTPDSFGDLSFNVAANYQSTYLTTDQPEPGTFLGDYTLVNLGAALKHAGGSPVDAELFMTNVFNAKKKASAQTYYYAVGVTAASYIEPRMFGVRLRYSFGE
jgi:iron complex outermembrane receptor protein